MSAREEILARIRAATADASPETAPGAAPGAAPEPVPRRYRLRDPLAPEARIERFIEVVTDYRAELRRVRDAPGGKGRGGRSEGGRGEGAVARAVAERLRARGVRRPLVPDGFPPQWLPAGLDPLRDTDLSPGELDAADGVISTCALAIAQTGTLVLDGGPGQGRRALTLVPDYHLCLVTTAQLVGIVPEAVAALAPAIAAGRPLTLVSGPSATSDIELERVEGVHGPRTLDILLIDAPAATPTPPPPARARAEAGVESGAPAPPEDAPEDAPERVPVEAAREAPAPRAPRQEPRQDPRQDPAKEPSRP